MSTKEFLNKKTKRDKNIKRGEKNEKEIINDKKTKEIKDNIILGIIKVEKNNFKRKIINSYENCKKESKSNSLKGKKNEEEIKGCEIYINDKKIDFNYCWVFQKKGNYKIKYVFKKLINSTNYMFFDCNSLISLDLSNFNT